MCGAPPIVKSFDMTENLCEWCTPDEDGDVSHGLCDAYTEEACACRNADHDLLTPEKMYEKMLAAMNFKPAKKEEVTV